MKFRFGFSWFGPSAAALAAAVALSGATAVPLPARAASAPVLSAPRLPYVLVEFAHTAGGAPQPMVISPSGRVIVDSQGEILDPLAGRVGTHTQTDGLQEAIDYALRRGLDVYVEGGAAVGKSNNNVYSLNKTLVIPPAQDFRIDGGEAVINYTGSLGNAIEINSCEDCHYRFGLVVTGAHNGAAVVFRPTEPTPIDHLVVITDSSFRFSSIATSAPVGTSYAGILLGAASGPILWNRIDATAVVGFHDNVVASSGVTYNRITVGHNHQAAHALVRIHAGADGNMWNLNDDLNGTASVGVICSGSNNTFTLQSSGFPAGKDVIFRYGATGNTVLGISPLSVTQSPSPLDVNCVVGGVMSTGARCGLAALHYLRGLAGSGG